MVHHSIDYKNSAVKYYLKIQNYVEVCKIYGRNRTSLMRRVKVYNENNFNSKHNKTRKSYKITKEYVIYIKQKCIVINYISCYLCYYFNSNIFKLFKLFPFDL